MLAATKSERAKGTLKRGAAVPERNTGEPTLAELGVTRKEALRAQRLASLPAAKREAVITDALTRRPPYDRHE